MCACGNAVCAALCSAYLCIYLQSYSTAYFLHPHSKTKTPTYTLRAHLSPAFFAVVSHQAGKPTHTHTHRKNSNKTQRCSSLCAQTCLTFGLGPRGLSTSIPPQQRGLSLGLLAPTGSLPGAHLLSLCALSMKLSHVRGAACWVTHTYTHTYTCTSLTRQWNRTGGQTVDTSPEPQWCPSFSFSLLFPISYLV